mmetsp:Transcript_43342/g.93411  ORF Transcript_43342/g.93411 Transcript_43342/m.93411 type:complete len:216 (+) Transcript_43342:124-771(+)
MSYVTNRALRHNAQMSKAAKHHPSNPCSNLCAGLWAMVGKSLFGGPSKGPRELSRARYWNFEIPQNFPRNPLEIPFRGLEGIFEAPPRPLFLLRRALQVLVGGQRELRAACQVFHILNSLLSLFACLLQLTLQEHPLLQLPIGDDLFGLAMLLRHLILGHQLVLLGIFLDGESLPLSEFSLAHLHAVLGVFFVLHVRLVDVLGLLPCFILLIGTL